MGLQGRLEGFQGPANEIDYYADLLFVVRQGWVEMKSKPH